MQSTAEIIPNVPWRGNSRSGKVFFTRPFWRCFFMSCLLFLFNEVGEKVTDTVNLIAIILLITLVVLAVVFCLRKKLNTKEIVYAGIAISTSFVLSYLKVSPVTNGGSITLASFVPIIIYAFIFGFSRGLIAGFIYGVLQFIQSPYILTPANFLLDYLLPFSMICLAPLSKKVCKNQNLQIVLSAIFVYLGRFLMHFLSGVIFFELGAVWAELPANSAVAYSLLYQVTYLIPDLVICAICLFILSKNGVIQKLQSQVLKQNG